MSFTHLHLHTEYSLLDGMGKIEPLLARARELGMESLAITDHGVLYGAVDFYLAAKEAGIKPIIGVEAYLARGSLSGRSSADKDYYHLVLLAKNETGYRNLIQLTTKAHLEGYYYKPRMDKELLQQHHQGLIALSACGSGEVARLLLAGRDEEAKAAALWYKEVFGDFYLELQEHAIPEFLPINKGKLQIARETGIPVVATNDVHYIYPQDAYAHDILLCIQTNSTVHDEKRLRMQGSSFYLKSPQEMAELFGELPEALANTQRIAEMCDLRLEFNRLHLPEFPVPPGKTSDEYLADLCWQGLRRRYSLVTPEIENRLRYELEVIQRTQFANYFLVVWDFVSFAKGRGILFGVRGSAAASIVLYCLGITEIDPLAYGLVFERFLNVERAELPDIDMDFADDRRDEVITYVTQKYGPDHVAQIITFGTLGAKAAIRDVGRALGMPYGAVDRVARLVPPTLNMSLERAMQESPQLQELYNLDPSVKHLVDTAQQLEGVARHASTHAAGVVISKDPLIHHVPLQRSTHGDGPGSPQATQGTPMTQFSMETLATIGLLKMDLLGLINLTILDKTVQMVRERHGVAIDLFSIPLDDPKPLELLAAGETIGVFQLESPGMRRSIKELKPSHFSDIAAMVALYRPGPMQHIPTFIRAKHGLEPIRFPHPALAEILKDTYGVIVYQDQVLLIVREFAGYTLGQADIFRKAMGKKIPEKMREERERFIAGAVSRGHPPELAERIFDLIEPFAGYAFNKAHSVSYGMIAYQTAYLKAHYPAEYMAALLTMYAHWPEKVATSVAECQRLGIPVLPPDINGSQVGFIVEDTQQGPALRFGFKAIKNVGEAALRPTLAERRRGGPFKNLEDFCRRADLRSVNKRTLECLIKVGALDSLGQREALLGGLDRIVALIQQQQRLRETGQATMFDLWGDALPTPLPELQLQSAPSNAAERLAWEKELLGVYLSERPFSQALRALAAEVTVFCGQIGEELAGQKVVVAGMVLEVRTLFTKQGKPFLSVTLEDLYGSVEVTVWNEVYQATQELWQEGTILIVQGRVRVREERTQLLCDAVRPYLTPIPEAQGAEPRAVPADVGDDLQTAPPVEVARLRRVPAPALGEGMVVWLQETEHHEADLDRLHQIVAVLQEYPGDEPVRLLVRSNGETVCLELPEARVTDCPELRQRLVGLLGPEALAPEIPMASSFAPS